MAEFTITSQPSTGGIALIKLAGELDSGNFASLEDEFNRVLESGATKVMLDLTTLDSVSSAGIGAFLDLARILDGRKGKLVLFGGRPKMIGLFEMLGICEKLNLVETIDQARKTMAS